MIFFIFHLSFFIFHLSSFGLCPLLVGRASGLGRSVLISVLPSHPSPNHWNLFEKIIFCHVNYIFYIIFSNPLFSEEESGVERAVFRKLQI